LACGLLLPSRAPTRLRLRREPMKKTNPNSLASTPGSPRPTRAPVRVVVAAKRRSAVVVAAAVLAACTTLCSLACGDSDDGIVRAKSASGGGKGGGTGGTASGAGAGAGAGGSSGGGQAAVVPRAECANIRYFTASPTHVYLGDDSTLRRFPLAGGAREIVDTYETVASAGGKTDIVVSGDDVFYALVQGGTSGPHIDIRRAHGGTSSVIFSLQPGQGLGTLAIAGTSLYVLTSDGVHIVPLAGGAPVTRCASSFGEGRGCSSLALDGASVYLACSESAGLSNPTQSFVRCDLETDETTVVGVPTGDVFATPTGHVLDLTIAGDSLVYVTTNYYLDAEVRAIPKAGGADALLTTADHVFPRLASNAGTVFLQDGLDPDANETHVYAIPAGVPGTTKQTLSTQAAFPAGITLVDSTLYAAYFRADGTDCGVAAMQP
jgi:hypothetical protein